MSVPAAVAVVFLVVTVAATAQAASGFGFALIATPLVALAVTAEAAVVGLAIAGSLLAVALALRGRGSIDAPTVARVALAAVVGMPLGVLVLIRTDDRTLTIVIAVAVLVSAGALARGVRLPISHVTDVVAGLAAGVLSTSTGTSGPPIVLALASKHPDPAAFRATISTIFLLQGTVSLAVFAIAGRFTTDAAVVAAAGVPGVAFGTLVGERVFRRLDERSFAKVVLGMLFASGVIALVGAAAS